MADWTTSNYTGANPTQDADPITGIMPDLADESAPGAGDGDAARSSHVEKPRDKLQTLAKVVGDSASPPEPAGSICEILDRDHTNGHARQIRMLERASKPSALGVANCGFLYLKDVGGITEGFYEDSAANEVQITASGKSMAETIKESGGTLLPVGAIADGQLLARVGAAIAGQMKCALNESTDPGAGDDSSDGFSVGSIWVNTTASPRTAWMCLDATATAAVWEQISGGGSATSPLTTKGDIWGYDSADARIPVGADGTVMTADSSESLGVKWSSPVSSRGAGLTVMSDVVTATRTVSSAAWADIDAVFDVTKIVPVTGTYRVTMSVRNAYSTSSYSEAFFRVLLDGSTQIGPGDEEWGVFSGAAGARNSGAFSTFIDLSAGSHTFKSQWWRAAASVGNVSLDVNGGSITVDLQLVSGSGAGGVLDPNKHVQSANRTITATSLSAVPTEAMSVTFSTGANETVRVGCHVQGYSASGTNTALVQLRLDGTLIGNVVKGIVAGSTWELPLNDSFDVKITDAGSHTLELYAATASSEQWEIVAGSWIDVDQYRGGYANMDSVLAKTADFNIEPEDSHRTYDNSGASGTVIGTLPAWELGLVYNFAVLAAQTFRVLTNSTSDNIRIAGSITAGASRYAEANTIGNTLAIRAVHGNVWLAFASNGTWTLST